MVEQLKKFSIKTSISARLLLLTISFVLLAEILIFVPTIANFRKTWLEEKLVAANIAVLAIEAAPDNMISEMLTRKLLGHAQVTAVSLKLKDKRQLMLNTDQPLKVAASYDIRDASYWSLIRDAAKIMFHAHPHGSLIQVTGYTDMSADDQGSSIQIIFQESLLCDDMKAFSYNVMMLSIIISLITAGLVYYSLSCLLIRPVQRMTRSVIAFRDAPENASETLSADDRQDEIGIVMRELSNMQEEVRKALNQKNHLAQLGESVSKINHDLRNILSSAQMVSDHLTTVDNPVVQKLTPRFVTAVDRAIRLCENTLKYGKAGVEKPHITSLNLYQIIEEVAISLGISDLEKAELINNIAPDFMINADTDQMFRVFLNLSRNALQAMNGRGQITLSAQHTDQGTLIDIIDNGPGIPDQIKKALFQPFHSGSNGGSGLGLAISKEIIEAHGGSIDLIRSDERGSHFRITLP